MARRSCSRPAPARQNRLVSVRIDTTATAIDGTVAAGAGTPDHSSITGHVTPGTLKTAQGRFVLADDNETVKFVPENPDEFSAVIAADASA